MLFVCLSNSALLGISVLLSILASCVVFLRVLRSPLRDIPNAHWSSSLSSAWILWTRYRGRELAILETKHQQLGPIVRLGPADLSISSYENGVRTIYNGGFEKPEYYEFFAYYGRKNAFCSMTRQDHSLRRKRMNAAYTKTALFTSEPLFSLTDTILSRRLLPILRNQVYSQQPTDVLQLSYALSLDLLTCFQFGLSSGSNFLENNSQLRPWLLHYEQRYCKEGFWPQELPSLTRHLQRFGIDMLPKSHYQSTQFLEDWLLDLGRRAELFRSEAEKGRTVPASDVPVVYQMVKRGVDIDMPNESPANKEREVASELFDQMSGGREVLGLVLAYTIFYISEHPHVQAKLRDELATLGFGLYQDLKTQKVESLSDTVTNPAFLPPPTALDKLPYLSAVLKESFRMRPNSTPLPRISPQDRAVSLAGIDNIPPGTRVNTFQWFIHRNPKNYEQVDEWRPERWLEDTPKDGKDPLLWAFGGGSRTCVGVSLTQYLMRYVLAVIYSNFSSRVISKKANVREPGSPEDEIIVQFESIKRL